MKVHDRNDAFGGHPAAAEPSGHRPGVRGPAIPPPRSGPPPPGLPRPQFEMTRRGYDRAAVDAFLDVHLAERQALRSELEAAERRYRQAEQRAASTERENRTLREDHSHRGDRAPSRAPSPSAGEGFGLRMEKLLRLAEQEVADARTAASHEAAVLLEQARARAEQHRHGVEQELIERSAELERSAAQRAADLQEREQQLARQLAAARSEAHTQREAAERAAGQIRERAEADAAAVRSRAEAEAARILHEARQESGRLSTVQGDARAEIARLVDVLAVELGGVRPPRAAGVESAAVGAVAPAEVRTAVAPAGVDGPRAAGDRSPVTAGAGR